MADAANGEQNLALPPQARPKRKAISVTRAVEEGVLIASAAVAMDAKNHIIVEALREGHPFDLDDVMATVRSGLRALARENDETAHRVEQLAAEVQERGGAENDSEGYHLDDHPTLTKRAIVNLRLGEELERLSENDAFVADVAERARLQAWTDVGDAISQRLIASLPKPPDRFYEEDKEQRIRALFAINLRALEKQAERRRGV
jgi:hypothetical protein